MARSALRSGISVTVWNRSSAKAEALAGDGAQAAGSVGEAVKDADCVITMLYDAEAVLTVADELVANAKPGALWLQCATIGLDGITRLAHRADDRVRWSTRRCSAPSRPPRRASSSFSLRAPSRPSMTPSTSSMRSASGPSTSMSNRARHRAQARLQRLAGVVDRRGCPVPHPDPTAWRRPAALPRRDQGRTPGRPVPAAQGRRHDRRQLRASVRPRCSPQGCRTAASGCRAAGVPTDLADALHAIYARSSTRGHGQDDIAAVRAAFDRDYFASRRRSVRTSWRPTRPAGAAPDATTTAPPARRPGRLVGDGVGAEFEEPGVGVVHERDVEAVDPRHRRIGLVVVAVERPTRGEQEITAARRDRVPVDHPPHALALDHEPDAFWLCRCSGATSFGPRYWIAAHSVGAARTALRQGPGSRARSRAAPRPARPEPGHPPAAPTGTASTTSTRTAPP